MKTFFSALNRQADAIGLTLLLIGNICFYTEGKLVIYLGLSLIAMLLIFGHAFLTKWRQGWPSWRPDFALIWLTLLYAMFTVYGTMFLRADTYNWDLMLFTYASNLALYCSLKHLIRRDWLGEMQIPVILAVMFTIVLLVVSEWDNLSFGGVRLGESLSGNVNTVATSLGILSVFLTCFSVRGKRKAASLLVLLLTVFFMLLTGSKMALILLAMDLVLFLLYAPKGRTKWLVAGFSASLAVLLIFYVPLFYNVIGYRVEDMLFQLFGIGPGEGSASTASRLLLLKEGFRFFLHHPLFGGGEKYFASLTSTGYGYSHCNYTEMLCNFGLFGTLLFYLPIFFLLGKTFRRKRSAEDLALLSLVLIFSRLLLDWVQVTYSGLCVGYLPLLFAFAAVAAKQRREEEKTQEAIDTTAPDAPVTPEDPSDVADREKDDREGAS